MSWRLTQLDNQLCQQDQVILQLFQNQLVRYVGKDSDFAKLLSCNEQAENLVLIVNRPMWCSQLRDVVKHNLQKPIKNFYIGVNRYCILGNDTTDTTTVTGGGGVLELLAQYVKQQGFVPKSQGMFDKDQGRHFNFVQPLTWMYGTTS